MTTLGNSVQRTSFQESFRLAYSHGLEAIYTLETVDVKSIKPLKIEPLPEKKITPANFELIEDQLEFDLGPHFRNWMLPYTLSEPIKVLQLGKSIEKILLEKSIKTIEDLKKVPLSFLGQGHIDEVQQKITLYLENKPLHKTPLIDFSSFLKMWLGEFDQRKIFVLLEPFDLTEWMTLTPLEMAEIKKTNEETKNIWKNEVMEILKNSMNFLDGQLGLLIDTWIKPWLAHRHDIAHFSEIEEYFLLRSVDPFIAKKTLIFIQSIKRKYLLPFLNEVEEDVYALELQFYQSLKNLTLSYFYNEKATYKLNEISHFIFSELAISWVSVSFETIEKFIRYFPELELRRESQGNWLVFKKYFI